MDITGDSQYQCWNLTEKDAEKVRELLSHAQKYEAIEMRDAIAAGLTGWWYGAYLMSEEKFMAVAYITQSFVYLFGRDKTAMRCIGRNLGRNSPKRSGTASHSIFGPDALVKAFWNGFEVAGKDVKSDTLLNLCELTEILCKQNDAYAVRIAEKKDFALVFEFLGEALIDELGMDVRRLSREGHEKYCSEQIANGRILVGTHRGKPAFVGEFRETPQGIFLEHAHFPIAMRRPKVMRGIHARVAELLLGRAPTLLFYVDAANEDLKAAVDEVGYHVVMPGRLMRLR